LGFAICTRCGYSDRERAVGKLGEKLPPGFVTHTPIWKRKAGSHCWNDSKAEVLRNYTLGAHVNTDLLQLDLSDAAPRHMLQQLSLTLAHALRIAGAMLLEVDERDLAVLSVRVGAAAFAGAQLYETTPGGSGHIAFLLKEHIKWYASAVDLLRGSDEHDGRCREACLSCILNSHSQTDYEDGNLNRTMTLDFVTRRIIASPTHHATYEQLPFDLKSSPQERAARIKKR
jgi:DEAD/DEAH box helicase domain-containing protein